MFSAYKSTWAFAMAWLLLAGSWAGLQPRVQAAPEPAPVIADPAREAVQDLLADDRSLNGKWLERANTLPGKAPVAEMTRLALEKHWSDILTDVQAIQQPAAQVLRVDQMLRIRELLVPYRAVAKTQTRSLLEKLDARLEYLVSVPGVSTNGVPVTWAQLERINASLDHIQEIVFQLRRLSPVQELPGETGFSLRLLTQMSVTFPTAVVRDFVNPANRLLQRRWALLFELEKSPPPVVVAPVAPSGNDRHQGLVFLALVGVVGIVLLIRQQHQVHHWQGLYQERAQTAQTLRHQLLLSTSSPQQNPAADHSVITQLAADLPDLRGRLKNIRMRFDSGQSLELAARDLDIVQDKLFGLNNRLASSVMPIGGTHA